MKAAIRYLDQINEWAGRSVAWLTAVLVVLIGLDVAFRYFLSETKAWVNELEWHLFALIFLFGAGYAFKHDRHVRADLFYSKMPARDKALVNLVGNVIFLIPWCCLIIWVSSRYAWDAYAIGETSPDPGGLPARFIIKSGISIGFVLLLLQGIGDTLRQLEIFRENKSDQSTE